MKLLSLKQKISFVSKEEGSQVVYDDGLLNPVFKHTLYVGLTDETIRREIKPVLDAEVSEDGLIQDLNTIVAREKERKGRLNKARVNMTEVEPPPVPVDQGSQSKFKEGKLWTELQELRAEINAIRQGTQATKSSSESDQPKKAFKMGCEQCRQNDNGSTCSHCWVCGSDEHFKAGCKQRRKPGNGQGSRRGGRR